MTCVQCGYHFHGFPHSQTGKLYYRCGGQTLQNSPDYSGGICHGYLVGEDVDNLIWNVIASILKCPDLILEQFERQQVLEAEETRNVANFMAYCEEQITSLENQRAKLLDLYLTDKIPRNLFDEKQLSLDEQLGNMHKKHTELQERLAEVKTIPDNYTDKIKLFCNAAQIGIDNFTAEDKRAVVEMLDIHVYVKRGATRKDDIFELTGFIPQGQVDSTFS